MPASGFGEGGGGRHADTWVLRDVTRDSTQLLRTIFRSLYPTIRSGVENMHEMLPLTHGRRVAIQMWSAPESRVAAQGPRPMGLNMRPPAHAPPALERALARAASSLGRRADMLWLAARVFHTGLPARASSPAGRGRSARPSRRSMATADPRRAWRCRRWSRHRAGTCARRGFGLRQYSSRRVSPLAK